MEPRIADYITALPEEANRPDSAQTELAKLLEELAMCPIPTGRVHRAWSLGTLSAKIAAGWMTTFVRGAFAGEKEREREQSEARLRAALTIFGRMGYLRGAVMKVGQLISTYPNLVPKELAEMLANLHFEAPPMHYALLAEHVRHELGGDPDDVFESFETHAFAAASLGQVHRARTKSGDELAVKIQYPGIGRTIQADFRNMSLLLGPMLLGGDRDNLIEQYSYVRDMMLLELDYQSEARFLERARTALADIDDVVVPRVYTDLSTGCVLSMERLEGLHLAEWLDTDPSQEERNRIADLLFRSTSRLFFSERLCWGDPHPGNVMVLNDGRLGLLDFGSCRAFDDHEWRIITLGVYGYRGGDEEFAEAMQVACDLNEKQLADSGRMKYIKDYVSWYWEPMDKPDESFDFTDPAYIQRGMELFGEGSRKRYTRSHPVNLYNARFLYGVRALAHMMRAQIFVGRIYEEELKRAGI